MTHLYQNLQHILGCNDYSELWQNFDSESFFERARELGSSLKAPTPEESKAFHDLKGGGIFGAFALAPEDIEDVFELPVLKSLASDHAKLIRSLFPFLDPAKSLEEESSLQIHTMDVYLEPWHRRILVRDGRPISIRVTNEFEGAITCRCVETSALDRTLLNLTNNAARFTQTSTIDMVTFQVGELVRWCILNSISPEESEWLTSRLSQNGLALFQRGLTRGGSGLGLESCADIIDQVFGVGDRESLVERGYLGAAMVESKFCAWFYWPVYTPKPEEDLSYCECKNG